MPYANIAVSLKLVGAWLLFIQKGKDTNFIES